MHQCNAKNATLYSKKEAYKGRGAGEPGQLRPPASEKGIKEGNLNPKGYRL